MSDEKIAKYTEEITRLEASIEQLHRERLQAKYALIVGLPLAAIAFRFNTLVGWVTLITVVTGWLVALYLIWVYVEDRRFHLGKVKKELATFTKKSVRTNSVQTPPTASETVALPAAATQTIEASTK